ncbi:Fic family protein [Campylobacter fetus subsp. venerealis]|uniref:Fic/DOC family protein n=1 Tax=Campylobacter fetus TaxID=196 RepID=UPI000818C07F|nr:Fic family protein [Campylobacter fetus]MBK3498179.1 Fic family protein [Campylobacter fetus subsp. venerealis]MBK3502189.1 Fic family protein [Campylobacter fetus subsp. venerealis]OCS16815.1 hypothetical protein CfvWBT01109_01905 [Campylobacter fetus subsp. venerealis]
MAVSEFELELLASNLVGADSLDELKMVERRFTAIRTKQLEKEPINQKIDYSYYKKIHRHLFQDVYDFAGKDRFEMGLTNQTFAKKSPLDGKYTYFTKAEEIGNKADEIFSKLESDNFFTDCNTLRKFSKKLATFFNEVNILHPFREGNGRATRILLNKIAKNAGYELDLNMVDKLDWHIASVNAEIGELKDMIDVIEENNLFFKEKEFKKLYSKLDDGHDVPEDKSNKDLPKIKEDIETRKNLEKNVDRFSKKQNILTPQAKTDLIKSIKKEYEILKKHKIELDKPYSDKIEKIIKENSKENQR